MLNQYFVRSCAYIRCTDVGKLHFRRADTTRNSNNAMYIQGDRRRINRSTGCADDPLVHTLCKSNSQRLDAIHGPVNRVIDSNKSII